MKRILFIVNIVLSALFVSPFIGEPQTTYIEEKFSIKNMPTSSILTQWNIIPSVLNEKDMFEINTVNHISKQVRIDQVLYDLDAIHYMLYQYVGLQEKAEEWLSKEDRTNEEIVVMTRFIEYIKNNSLRYKSRFYAFNEETNFILIADEFIDQLFVLDKVNIELDFLTNKSIKPYEIRFYEDFDEEKMVAGVYGLYSVYDKKTYYKSSDVCDEFNLYSKITEEEQTELIDTLEEDNYFEEEECSFYLYEKLDHKVSFEILPEEFYEHEITYVFDYQSHSTKPYVRMRVVFDYFFEEKLMVSSPSDRFKISKEANDYRNQYNVERIDVYEEILPIPVDVLYPHRTLVEDKELWFYTKSNYFHQMLEGNQKNVKYRKDLVYYDVYNAGEMLGGYELIYNTIGFVVYDPLTTFTFNYGIGDMDHYLKDVYPFLLWGTSKENREDYSMVERFIWDKDRFTVNKYGQFMEKNALRQYYDNRLKNVIIGTGIPIALLDEIDAFYEKTR